MVCEFAALVNPVKDVMRRRDYWLKAMVMVIIVMVVMLVVMVVMVIVA